MFSAYERSNDEIDVMMILSNLNAINSKPVLSKNDKVMGGKNSFFVSR
jgi:hypothetical protein